ncbi:MAG: hypothetical protein ACFFBD_04935, partial [Candidatus Hodarchaeota archaeon]
SKTRLYQAESKRIISLVYMYGLFIGRRLELYSRSFSKADNFKLADLFLKESNVYATVWEKITTFPESLHPSVKMMSFV